MTTNQAKLLQYFSNSSIITQIPKWANGADIETLRAMRYISLNITQTHAIVTDEGRAALSEYYIQRSERLWTRWIAVIALIISIATFILELDNHGFFDDVLSKIKICQSSNQREAQAQETQ